MTRVNCINCGRRTITNFKNVEKLSRGGRGGGGEGRVQRPLGQRDGRCQPRPRPMIVGSAQNRPESPRIAARRRSPLVSRHSSVISRHSTHASTAQKRLTDVYSTQTHFHLICVIPRLFEVRTHGCMKYGSVESDSFGLVQADLDRAKIKWFLLNYQSVSRSVGLSSYTKKGEQPILNC